MTSGAPASCALESDVLVENFRPGVMAGLGLGYEQLTALNPGLIYCSITGFGSGGGALPGYDLLVQALGGLMSITGTPDGEPQKVGVAVVDVLAGLFSTVGILAATRHRDATGRGQLVEVSLLSALLGALVNQGSAYTIAAVVPQRMGNAHPEHRALRTAGDWRWRDRSGGRQRSPIRRAVRGAGRRRARSHSPVCDQRRSGRQTAMSCVRSYWRLCGSTRRASGRRA